MIFQYPTLGSNHRYMNSSSSYGTRRKIFQYPTLGSNHRYPVRDGMTVILAVIFQYPTLGSNHRYKLGKRLHMLFNPTLSVSYSRIEPSLRPRTGQ